LQYSEKWVIIDLGGDVMSKKDKLITRLKSKPKDFKFIEAKSLMRLCGYSMSGAGKTSGSQVYFAKDKKVFYMHKPHPQKELHLYQINAIIKELEQEGLI